MLFMFRIYFYRFRDRSGCNAPSGLLWHPHCMMAHKDTGTALVNNFLASLYASGFWIPKTPGLALAGMLRGYMMLYQRCACESVRRQINRFPMVPKAHMLSHCAEQMFDEAARSDWIMNPIATGNQQQEDFIGRPCRLSRRVHARRLHRRVMQRSLLAGYQALFPNG